MMQKTWNPAKGTQKGSSFNERCYFLLNKVPKGKVTTYKALANALGTSAYRAVGNAMNKNPYAPKIPCHRVINANGELGGFAHGLEKKKSILKAEGVQIKDEKIDLKKYGYFFD
jgi:methylated-DNA-[protein]-cysteine S-methyltransferase